MNDQPLVITHFCPEDQAEVKNLILSGMAEHFGTLDLSKNDDLNDIGVHYAAGVFLVAHLNGRIVGTGALVPRSDGVAEIVRMSVAKDDRRQGIGTAVLERLIQHANHNGYRQVVLETTAAWGEVITFYLRYGFCVSHYKDGDVYFALTLK